MASQCLDRCNLDIFRQINAGFLIVSGLPMRHGHFGKALNLTVVGKRGSLTMTLAALKISTVGRQTNRIGIASTSAYFCYVRSNMHHIKV